MVLLGQLLACQLVQIHYLGGEGFGCGKTGRKEDDLRNQSVIGNHHCHLYKVNSSNSKSRSHIGFYICTQRVKDGSEFFFKILSWGKREFSIGFSVKTPFSGSSGIFLHFYNWCSVFSKRKFVNFINHQIFHKPGTAQVGAISKAQKSKKNIVLKT